jgi:excisionase family DNA binding protein
MNFENINNLNELPLTLNVSDVAGVLGISINKAYELCHSKKFPSVKVGKRRLIIPRPAFEVWMSNPCI